MLKDRKSFYMHITSLIKNDAFFCLFKSVMLFLLGVNYKKHSFKS
jgi:hypothetical protein